MQSIRTRYFGPSNSKGSRIQAKCEAIGPSDAEFIEPGEQVESVRIMVGASAAYACIKGPSFSLDVRLPGGRSATDDLHMLATEEREKAHRLIKRAYRMECAAELLSKKVMK